MFVENSIWSLAESFVTGTLPEHDLNELKDKLAGDSTFALEFNECVNLIRSLNGNGDQKRFRSLVNEVHQDHILNNTSKQSRTIPLKTHYLRTAAIAAGIAMLTSLTTFWIIQHNNKRIASQYSLLRRDLEKYKRSQNQIINNIKDQKTTPTAQVRYTGTGFALSNNGYLVTNYHVTEGADSVYIQNKEGKYYKASVISFDQNTDIAILKVEDKSFHFGKGEIPYTFASNKKELGTRVYSLGFPDEEIVYNEGYISARNGFEGDSMQYRLDLPANPGQSGAPVIDAKGNVVAIITGKESESQGSTYAVSSKALLQLMQSLPKESGLRTPKTNKLNKLSLEQQIEKLQYYTFIVKVYKK
jgi:serine protease Do